MDLKPANILLDDLMVPKITDFGLSRLDNNSQAATTSRLMSLGYCAPEYILEGKWSSKSDIYSLGVMVTEMVTGSKKGPDLTKVLRRWRHRWIKSSKHTPLGYQQVTKCLELAQRCIQINPTARPDIVYVMDELNTIDSKGGQFQEIPCLEDMLGIEPLEIHFPFKLDLQISHSIELTNDTNDYIAFITKARSRCFRIEPDKGIVPPGSKCSVTVTTQAQVNALPNNHHKEEITVLSTRVDGGLAAMDITGDVFIEKEGTVVDEVNVMVVFDKPPPADEES
ncbi:G-type lectin S-receptor-like serine/threonine-protein kinase At1g67520 isoform X1 [Miscanthus floridulus]|uniref:G-type lectin S-receptor-like serine/threonine-protein kinase At1g67520 isoform X1 n=1 Tax=Miscanthus floridulus TaxID=154761 RepID=UPI00345868EE